MRRLINCLRVDVKYMILSPRFLLACFAYVGISLLSIMAENYPNNSVYYLNTVYENYPFWMFYLLLGVIPGSAAFCADWETKFYRFSVVNAGKKVYAISKVVSCFFSAFLLVFLSKWLFVLILGWRWPMYNNTHDLFDMKVFINYASNSNIWKYFMFRIVTVAFSAGTFSVFALWLSTKITNIFVVLFSPIILFYLVNNFTFFLGLPYEWSLIHIIKGVIVPTNRVGSGIISIIAIFIGLAAVFGFAFYFGSKRRMENA